MNESELPTNEEIATLVEEITKDNLFSLSLDELATNISNIIDNITSVESSRVYKELEHAKIYLSMARNELNQIKQHLDF